MIDDFMVVLASDLKLIIANVARALAPIVARNLSANFKVPSSPPLNGVLVTQGEGIRSGELPRCY